ncbi:zinc finger protein [Coleophoma crateriformis]|uniref:Zinc finger protein n=1 Tax=Coleophoma crateriformis TaxID=565419 RepID=A0A3D8T9S7_9HELO|nr:zinc finger protein [Coleophoma crateriformis]
MCKHILNAQVSIRAPCCKDTPRILQQSINTDAGKRWFDCAECHAENETHPLLQKTEMTFVCKKCKKAFRKDAEEFDESDEYCPHCDNHFVLEAVTPKPVLEFEGEDIRKDSRMIRDDRIKQEEARTIFDVKDAPNKLG